MQLDKKKVKFVCCLCWAGPVVRKRIKASKTNFGLCRSRADVGKFIRALN